MRISSLLALDIMWWSYETLELVYLSMWLGFCIWLCHCELFVLITLVWYTLIHYASVLYHYSNWCYDFTVLSATILTIMWWPVSFFTLSSRRFFCVYRTGWRCCRDTILGRLAILAPLLLLLHRLLRLLYLSWLIFRLWWLLHFNSLASLDLA